jgi:hypothetical protein
MMNTADAKRHASHLCDVWSAAEGAEHVGVIEYLSTRGGARGAMVAGHPAYGSAWLPLEMLSTGCKIID